MLFKEHIKEMIKSEHFGGCLFERYMDGRLIYSVYDPVNGETYEFDIPIEETKGGIFNKSEKVIHLMGWIRRAIENKTYRKV